MDNRKIFIGNLDFNVKENELKMLLSKSGTVVSIKLHQKKGYSFAEMSTAEEALEVVKQLDGLNFKNREIRASLLMKKNKAKSTAVKRYREKGAAFSAKKKADEAAAKDRNEKSRGSSRSQSGGRGESRSSSYNKPQSGFNRGSRFSRDEDRTSEGRESRGRDYSYSRERTGDDEDSQSRRPERKGWAGSPAYSSKSSRYGIDGGEEYKENGNRPKWKKPFSRERYPGGFKKAGSGPAVKAWTAVKPERFKRDNEGPERGDADKNKRDGNRGTGFSGGGYSGSSSGNRNPSAWGKKGTGRRNVSNPSGPKSRGTGGRNPGGRQGRG